MVRYVEEGYTTVKFKVGSNDGTDMERDLRRIEKVRKAVGDKIGVAVDCNQRWDVDSAYKFAKLCEPYHLAWLEEPFPQHERNPPLKGDGGDDPHCFWRVHEDLL